MKNYQILLSFLSPQEGYAFLSGETEEEVKEKAAELFSNRTNVKIVEVKELDEEVDYQEIIAQSNGELQA